MSVKRSYKIKYKNNQIDTTKSMADVPYIIVKNLMCEKNDKINFEEFKDLFYEIKKIISGSGNTEFLLEEDKIGDENDTSNTRRDNYVNGKSPLLIFEYDGVETKFGVYREWQNNKETSNFARFIKEVTNLGYEIEVLEEEVKEKEFDKTIKSNIVKVNRFNKKLVEEINRFINYKGYYYKNNDLSNFYLSLKTKPFIILAGISGTGKSKLVRLFGEAIQAEYFMISVKPDWNDSAELLGYKDIKNEFIQGELLKIIIEASKEENKNKPYIVCLDEMNLARVEYYFSEYLSKIESRRFKNDQIITDYIFNDDLLGNDINKLIFPEKLYIIGTVNMDDTTFSFSRKVLDRANTIEFSEVNLENLDFNECDSKPIDGVENSFLKTRFINIKDALADDSNKDYVKNVNTKIVEINKILETYSKHFGYRVRDEIVFYMLENKIAGLLDEDTAFDYQIMQKVLPKLNGSDYCIKEILLKLFKICTDIDLLNEDYYIEEAEKIVNDDEKEYKYKKSSKKIVQMLKGYKDGFVSFW